MDDDQLNELSRIARQDQQAAAYADGEPVTMSHPDDLAKLEQFRVADGPATPWPDPNDPENEARVAACPDCDDDGLRGDHIVEYRLIPGRTRGERYAVHV